MKNARRTGYATGARRSLYQATPPFYAASAPAATFANQGIDIPANAHGEARTLCPQCGPDHHRRNKTLSINTAKGIWHCHRCGWSGALTGGKCQVVTRPSPAPLKFPSAQGQRLSKLRALWKAAVPLDHADAKPARAYLRVRGLGEVLSDLPADLRLHSALAYWDQDDDGQWRKWGEFPALLALVRDRSGIAQSLHRTYLKTDGSSKADVPSPKKLMPSIVEGGLKSAAIRLYAATEQLAVAEGIETALAVRVATGLPVWATVSAGGMARLQAPEQVGEVLVAADNDASRAGEQAAYTLAKRLITEGITVKVVLPDGMGTDWADVLMGGQAHG